MAAPVVRKRTLNWPFLAVCLLTVLIISPVDPFPEMFAGPIGLLDDLGYGILDIILLLYIRHKKKLEEQQAADKPGLDPGKKIS